MKIKKYSRGYTKIMTKPTALDILIVSVVIALLLPLAILRLLIGACEKVIFMCAGQFTGKKGNKQKDSV